MGECIWKIRLQFVIHLCDREQWVIVFVKICLIREMAKKDSSWIRYIFLKKDQSVLLGMLHLETEE